MLIKGGGEQSPGIVVLRVGDDFGCRAAFHNTAVFHYCDLVSQAAHYPQVMGDKDIGDLVFSLQVEEELYDLVLDGDIQGTGWFIQD